MKKVFVFSFVFGAGIVFGASGLIQPLADAAQQGMEVLESSAIQLVENEKTEKSDSVKEAEKAAGEKKSVLSENTESSEAAVPKENEKSFWMGATIGPVPAPILAQIPEETLPEGKGVFLAEILKDSPAAKAELKAFDVVVKVNGDAVNPEELAAKVRDSKGEKLVFDVLRAGKIQPVEVTPEERPAMSAANGWRRGAGPEGMRRRFGFGMPQMEMEIPEGMEMDAEVPEGMEEMESGMEEMGIPEEMRDMMEQQGIRFPRFRVRPFRNQGVNPGENMNQGQQMKIEMTPNGTHMSRSAMFSENGETLRISVSKDGDEPAKVLVERNDESWETTEDDLDKIPEEIRGKVKSFLESGSIQIHMNNGTETKAIPAPAEKKGDSITEAPAVKEGNKTSDSDAKDADAAKDAENKEIPIQKKDVIDLK